MITRKSAAKTKSDATKAAAETARASAESAKAAAEAARTKATTQASVIKQKVGPQLEQGLTSTLTAAEQARQWATPHVEATAERVGPVVVAAKERFNDQVRPKLEEALTAAAIAGAAAATTALHKAAELAESAAEATATVPDLVQHANGTAAAAKKHRRRRIGLLLAVGATAGAVGYALKRRADQAGGASWEYVPPLGDTRLRDLDAEESALEDALAASALEDLDLDDLAEQGLEPEDLSVEKPAAENVGDVIEPASGTINGVEVVDVADAEQAEASEGSEDSGAKRPRRRSS